MSEGVCQKSGSLACAAGSDGQGGEIVERGGVVFEIKDPSGF